MLVKKIISEADQLPVEMCYVKIFLHKMREKIKKVSEGFQSKLFRTFIKSIHYFDRVLKKVGVSDDLLKKVKISFL